MKLLIENLFWIIIIIFGSIYLIFLEIENYNNKKSRVVFDYSYNSWF